MNITKEHIEKVQDNWNRMILICEKITDDSIRSATLEMCAELKNRLSVCPASTRLDFIGAYMGGLVETSLKTTKLMVDLNKAYPTPVELDSIILTGLFSQLGKIGDATHDYYLEKDSQWHNDRGIMFEINEKISKAVSIETRSIWWLTSSGIQLSLNEIHAITSLGTMGQVVQGTEELYDTSLLAALLQHATRVTSITSDSRKKSILDLR